MFFDWLLETDFSWFYRISTYVDSFWVFWLKYKMDLSSNIQSTKNAVFILKTRAIYSLRSKRSKREQSYHKFETISSEFHHMNHLTFFFFFSFMIHITDGIYLWLFSMRLKKKIVRISIWSPVALFFYLLLFFSIYISIYFYKCVVWNSNGVEKKSS